MKHLGTKELQTDRLLLRRFHLGDAQAMYHNWAGDPDVTRFLSWPTHQNAEISERVLEDWISHYSEADYYQWAVVLKEYGNLPIGSIGVVNSNEKIEMVEVGYCIGKKWWNQGVTSEALSAVIRFFLNEVGINRVESRHDTNNANSGKVMLKCGMKHEGIKRQADWNNQGLNDTSLYAVLASDYAEH